MFKREILNNTAVVCRCKDGYVKVYIQGQEEEHKYDKPDYEFCGEETHARVSLVARHCSDITIVFLNIIAIIIILLQYFVYVSTYVIRHCRGIAHG